MWRGDILNNLNMNELLNILSKMDKKDLQNSINKANEIMNSKDRDKIIEELKKNLNNNNWIIIKF